MFKLLKSENGYSLIEIGVGLIIISIFLVCSVSLLNGTFNNYRIIEQRNVAMSYAINRMERALNMDVDSLLEISYSEDDIRLSAQSASSQEQAEGKYAVLDIVEGVTSEGVKFEDETLNNMVITTSVRRIPVTNDKVFDSSILKINVKVDYKIKPSDVDVKSFELSSIKVTKP